MSNATYKYLKVASPQRKAEMLEIVAGANELAHEEAEWSQYVPYYTLERLGRAWAIAEYVDYAVPGFEDLYEHGEFVEAGCFVYCTKCGGLRDLWDGQIEFCTDCLADW